MVLPPYGLFFSFSTVMFAENGLGELKPMGFFWARE